MTNLLKGTFAFICFISCQLAVAQQQYAELITSDRLFEHVALLASDSLEGRETGKDGQKMAADYIKNQFKEFGLEGISKSGDAYYQEFQLEEAEWQQAYVTIDGKKLKNLDDVLYFGSQENAKEVKTRVVFAGNGDEAVYENLDVDGKAVLITLKDRRQLAEKIKPAKEAGAVAVLGVMHETKEDFEKMRKQMKPYLSHPRLTFPDNSGQGNTVFFISPEHAGKIFKTEWSEIQQHAENPADFNKKSKKIAFKTEKKITTVDTENVLGFLEGSEYPDEVLVITAHYDHIGMEEDGTVNNGADDDASGSSAVIELARAFAKAAEAGEGPKRSILFMTVTGEEKGLLGSQYYTENPIFPLDNTVANLNIDMIGRIDDDHITEEGEEDGNYIYLIGSDKLSTELHEISEEMNDKYTSIDLDYTYNDENDPNRFYYRSDHYNFAKNNVPVIFYFNGVHEDYHKPTDTPDKIIPEKMEPITRLVFYTAWEVANREDRIVVDVNKK